MKRRLAGEHAVKDDAQRVHVGFVIDIAGVAALLRRHVQRGAHHDPGARHDLIAAALVFLLELGDTKVEQLGALAARHLRVLHDHDVVGLQVAVDDLFGVGGRQCGGQLLDQPQCIHHRHPSGGLHPRVERLALEQLHDDVGGAVRELTKCRDLDQALMINDVDGAGLVDEAGGDLLVLGVLFVEDFDGDALTDGLVDGFKDGAHAAFPDLGGDAVLADLLADHRCPLLPLGLTGSSDRKATLRPRCVTR